jgi:hypothetical protein
LTNPSPAQPAPSSAAVRWSVDNALAALALALMVLIPAIEVALRPTLGRGIDNAPVLVQHLGLVLAIQVGWALSATLSPYSGGSMILARILGRNPTVFRIWNQPWAAACLALYGALLVLLD